MIIEVRAPVAMDVNNFSPSIHSINATAVKGVERANKGRVDDHYFAKWDDEIAPVPTDAEMLAAETTYLADKQIETDKAQSQRDDVALLVTQKGAVRSALEKDAAIDRITNILESLNL